MGKNTHTSRRAKVADFGNVIDETFDVTVTLTPPATPPADTESTTAVLQQPLPNSTLKVKRGKLKLSTLRRSQTKRYAVFVASLHAICFDRGSH